MIIYWTPKTRDRLAFWKSFWVSRWRFVFNVYCLLSYFAGLVSYRWPSFSLVIFPPVVIFSAWLNGRHYRALQLQRWF